MTRFGGFVIDIVVIAGVFAAGRTVEYLCVGRFRGLDRAADLPVVGGLLLVAWAVFYCAYPLAVGGRTLGMAVVGLRVRADGSDLDTRRAVVRVLAFPLSFLLFGLGFLLILLKRDRRALHDLVAGTAVVYAWDARARAPVPGPPPVHLAPVLASTVRSHA